MNDLASAWDQLRDSISAEQSMSGLSMAVYMVVGGLLAIYVRMLFRYCGASASDSDSITRVFPLLTLVTIGVIAVVKSSLALSLGMVGALSIVRFRAAIKEPEELVYLFLCIGIGLCLGAGQPLLAVVIVVVATVFILGMHWSGRTQRSRRIILTVTGDADRYFKDPDANALKHIEEVAGTLVLQRIDVEEGRGQIRVVVPNATVEQASKWVSALYGRLPGCEISYVDLNSTY